MKYAVIEVARSKILSAKTLCTLFEVSRSGFIKWKNLQKPVTPSANDESSTLESLVIRTFLESKKIYGYRKICKKLTASGVKISPKKTYFLMAKNKLKSKTKKPWHPTTTDSTHKNIISPRVFQIESTLVSKPNQVWAGDITYIPTLEGWVYLSVFIDLFSRKAIGWAIDDHLKTEIVKRSFTMALQTRQTEPGLIVHSDRGVQYTSSEYRWLIENLSFLQSMSRTGNCYDNAFVESFFSQLKKELPKKIFISKEEAKNAILDFINNWYNSERIHSSIDYLTPNQFESNYVAQAS